MLTTAELAKHFRSRMRAAEIPCHVRKASNREIIVSVPDYNFRWTKDQIFTICLCAKCNHMTFVRGIEIDPNKVCELEFGNGNSFSFYRN